MVNMQHELLREDLDLEEAEDLQTKYYSIIQKQENAPYKYPSLKTLKRVVGVDISYYEWKGEEFGVSCAALWDIFNEKLEYCTLVKDKIKFPYHAGFLGFRECNLLAQAIKKLPKNYDLIMCDGHGIIHPRRFGEAVQLGFALDTPTIGIAKKSYIGYCEWSLLKRKRGDKKPVLAYEPNLRKKSKQEMLGYAICLNDNMKPVFISVGYRTTLDLAIKIALKTTLKHRQPEPLYLADHLSKEKVKEILSS